MNKRVTTSPAQDDPIATIPAIMEMAERYKMAPKAFVYTFRTVAMPQPHSDAEFVSCCLVAHAHGLNPLTKELYFMKTRSGGIQAIVSVDGWAKKCNEHHQFDGMEFVDEHDDNGNLISTTCIIYRKDRKHPIKTTEYLDECLKVGGPVWRTSPRRMLRHRALTQCARYAFGFAGIMDKDEYDQWQAMRDVTPKATAISATHDVPEIPEIPDDVPELSPDDETSGLDDPAPETLPEAEQEKLLSKLKDDLAFCKSYAEREEVAEQYEDMLDRLSDANRRRVEAIFEGREK